MGDITVLVQKQEIGDAFSILQGTEITFSSSSFKIRSQLQIILFTCNILHHLYEGLKIDSPFLIPIDSELFSICSFIWCLSMQLCLQPTGRNFRYNVMKFSVLTCLPSRTNATENGLNRTGFSTSFLQWFIQKEIFNFQNFSTQITN